MSEALKSVKLILQRKKPLRFEDDVPEGYQESIQDKLEADLSKCSRPFSSFLVPVK